MRTWALDNGDQFPMKVPGLQGGASESVGQRTSNGKDDHKGVNMMFGVMSNELSTPKVLICPSEYDSRGAASTYSYTVPNGANATPFTNDLNVSYFVGVDAQDQYPQMFLTGDHNLGEGANPPTIEFQQAKTGNQRFNVSLGTNFPTATTTLVGWLDNMHSKQGNVGLADGSVQGFSTTKLREALKNTGDPGGNTTPSFPAATGHSPAGVNRLQFP
jgi:prepilin-type processing-associated H-X9-DG protein